MRDVFKNKQYTRFLIGNTISFIGNGMYFIALSWLVLQLSGSTSAMGWLLAVSTLPGIFLSSIMGVLIDRWDRRIICIVGDIFRGSILIFIPLFYYLNMLEIWMLYTVGFFLSLGNRLYYPASGALIREIVPVTQLLTANSINNIFVQTGSLIGSGIGGVLIMHFSPMSNILINAASFFVSAVFTLFIRGHISLPQKPTERKRMLMDYAIGINYLKMHPYIIGLSVLTVCLYVAVYTSNVILPSYATQILKAGSVGFGLIESGWAAGAIAGGALLLSFVSTRVRDSHIIKIGLFTLSLIIITFSVSQNIPQAVIGYFFMGLLFVSLRIKIDTMVQSTVEHEFQGRVKSSIYMAIDCISLPVYLGMGYIGEMVSLRAIYVSIGFLIFFAFMFSFVVFKGKVYKSSFDNFTV